MAFPATPLLDTFNRSDEGPPPSASWVTNFSSGNEVFSNECRADGVDGGSSWNTQFQPAQEVWGTLAAVPADGGGATTLIRLQDPADFLSDHYETTYVKNAGATNDIIVVYKAVLGVFTQLGSDIALGADLAAGDHLGTRAVESTLDIYLNNTAVAQRLDSDVTTAGYIGIYQGDTTSRLDNFGGGNFVGPPFQTRPNPTVLAR